MRKIRLSDTDLELFDIEISPSDFNFYQKHKDAFRTMWKEQGVPFWTRFVITFRSFTVKHGVIKQMNIDSPKFQNLIDQAFIFIHEQFVDGSDKIAKNFIEDIARLAQHQDKLPALDSKSFAKDPFYARDTRELFRQFFGKPDQRSSYLKVYILCPVFLRFGGSVCRCLLRWVDAPIQTDPSDDSYWTRPQDTEIDKSAASFCDENTMCKNCLDSSKTQFFNEKINGGPKGPMFLECWTLGDPRFNDPENPLFSPHFNPEDDWRERLTIERFRNFLQYAKFKYTPEQEHCEDCKQLRQEMETVIDGYRKGKKKKKKKKKSQDELIHDLKEVKDKIDELESMGCFSKEEYEKRVHEIIKEKPKVMEAIKEVENHEKRIESDDDETLISEGQTKTKDASTEEKNPVFSTNAKVTDDFQQSLMSSGDFSNKSVVAGFKVIKIEDEKNGLYEVNISAASIKTDEEESSHKMKLKKEMKKQELNNFILTAAHLQERMAGLPNKFEWWEGRGFCVAVLNYEDEEKQFGKKWTNFTLKVTGYREKPIKQIMISLLWYIDKRKRRTCHGWNMEVDDVVACILPEESVNIEDLSISIQRGFRFEERLTEEERESLIKHQPNFCFDRVLMGVQTGDVSNILTAKGGKDKLKKMCKAIAKYDLYGDKNVEELMTLLRSSTKNGKTEADILWDKMITDPDKFEFFCLVDKDKESDFKKTGMKTFDVRQYTSKKNPTTHICPICKNIELQCCCNENKIVCGEAMQLIDLSKQESVEVLDQKIPKMTYKEFSSMLHDERTAKKTEKKSKSANKKAKGKKIELSGLPKRLEEVGVVADKTLISIPAKQEAELMGKVPVSMEDKEDRMAPIPGLTSSLDLILQNGGKEQTITVSLGAYMPEGKIQQMEDKKREMKLHDYEAQKMEEKLKAYERKDEKKSKKDKNGKTKNISGKSKNQDKTNDGVDEQDIGLDAMMLKEFLDADEATRVAKQLNTQYGISYKKQPVLGEIKKKEGNEVRSKKGKESVEFKSKEESQKSTHEKKQTDDSRAGDDENSNNNSDILVSEMEGETVVISSKPLDEELSQKLSALREGMSSCHIMVVNDDEDKTEFTVADFESEQGMIAMTCDVDGLPLDTEKVKDISVKTGALKKCWNCHKEEPTRKAFKKCQKCKDIGVENPRYYCSRECQMDDWKEKHKMEHKNNLLQLKIQST